MFFASFMLSWLLFGVIYWVVGLAHGDFEPDNLPGGPNQSSGAHVPCVAEIYNFTSAFLFSVETQHTIG